MAHKVTVELPDTTLGSDRKFQYGYFGHGDIFMATWSGDAGYRPTVEDGVSTCFNMAHGNDATALAALVGYMRRCGIAEDGIAEFYHAVADEILADPDANPPYSMRTHTIRSIAQGEPLTRFDMNTGSEMLRALTVPIPTQPGVLERTGGTGFYTKGESADMVLVIAGVTGPSVDALTVVRRAELCMADMQPVGRAICQTVLGEYWRELRQFVTEELEEAGGITSEG